MEIICEFITETKINYLIVDSWYSSSKVLLQGLINGCYTIGRIKSNRVIHTARIKTNIKEFSSTLEPMKLV